jgi:adenine-specific DNA-methyltransferase
VLEARMNQDLRMADKLKATGAGNLFVVFGEPDIRIHELPDDMLKGRDFRHGYLRSNHG